MKGKSLKQQLIEFAMTQTKHLLPAERVVLRENIDQLIIQKDRRRGLYLRPASIKTYFDSHRAIRKKVLELNLLSYDDRGFPYISQQAAADLISAYLEEKKSNATIRTYLANSARIQEVLGHSAMHPPSPFPTRIKRTRREFSRDLPEPDELIALARQNLAEAADILDDVTRAIRVRTACQVFVFAEFGPRVSNLKGFTEGERPTIIKVGDAYAVTFDADHMKNHKDYSTKLSPECSQALDWYKKLAFEHLKPRKYAGRQGDPKDSFWLSARGGAQSTNSAYKAVVAMTGISPHAFRHSLATSIFNAHSDGVRRASVLLGNTKREVRTTYVHRRGVAASERCNQGLSIFLNAATERSSSPTTLAKDHQV